MLMGMSSFSPALAETEPLRKDHGVRINIIMDGGEFVRNRESHPGHDDVRHSFSVQNGEALVNFMSWM